MSDHQNIEELFRSKLGKAELTPSKGVWKGVQRQLRLRQFLRFDAGSFNIWYLGALLVAGAAAVALLNNSPSLSVEDEQSITVIAEELQEAQRTVEAREESKGISRKEGEKSETTISSFEANEQQQQQQKKKKKKKTDQASGTHTELQAEPEEGQAGITEQEPVEATGEPEIPEQVKKLEPWFTASITEGCAPLQVKFSNSSINATKVSWNFGNGEASEDLSPVYLYEEAGTYAVAMNVVGLDGASGEHHQVIRVHPAPVAAFEMGEGLEALDGSISMELMNYSTGGFSYSWDMLSAEGQKEPGWSSNEYQPLVTNRKIPENARRIRMVVENEQGCTDTATAKIISMNGAERTLLFPTVFSANHTGPTGGHYNQQELRRDIFHPHYNEEPAEYQLRVYSKMGEIIFETRDIQQGWDGYYHQTRTAGGVYLWVAEGIWQNGTSFNFKGDITLLWSDQR